MQALTYGAWAFAAGVLIPVLAALSGSLGRQLGSAGWAAAILLTVALAGSLIAAAATDGAPNLSALQGAPLWQLASGLVMAFYLLTAAYLSPRFGVGPTVLFVVTAQIVTSAVIGHFGWLGAPRQPIDLIRSLGLALMLGGLVLTQLRRA